MLAAIRRGFPWLPHLFAGGGDDCDKLGNVRTGFGQWTVEIIKRPAGKGLQRIAWEEDFSDKAPTQTTTAVTSVEETAAVTRCLN